jgi:hypothetical protein
MESTIGNHSPVAALSPGAVDHWLRCAMAPRYAVKVFGDDQASAERELALTEQIGKASAQ